MVGKNSEMQMSAKPPLWQLAVCEVVSGSVSSNRVQHSVAA